MAWARGPGVQHSKENSKSTGRLSRWPATLPLGWHNIQKKIASLDPICRCRACKHPCLQHSKENSKPSSLSARRYAGLMTLIWQHSKENSKGESNEIRPHHRSSTNNIQKKIARRRCRTPRQASDSAEVQHSKENSETAYLKPTLSTTRRRQHSKENSKKAGEKEVRAAIVQFQLKQQHSKENSKTQLWWRRLRL